MQIPHRSKRASGILGHLFIQGIEDEDEDDDGDDDEEEDDNDEDTTIEDVPSDR